jgi:RHS repeat-associated protein
VQRAANYVPLNDAISNYVVPQLADYSYDALNRIGSYHETQYNGSAWVYNVAGQTFSYDRYGNRQITATLGGVNGYNPSYNANNNRIVGLSYDSAGNLTNDGGKVMTYDAENHMVSATGGNYGYDGEGKRVKRVASGQEWWYVYGLSGELVAEYLWTAPTTVQKEYGYRGGQMLVVGETGNVRWLVQDHLGSTRMTAEASGSLTGMKRQDYLPFGEDLYAGLRRNGGNGQYGYEPPASTVRQKFTGYERDGETGLDFAQARMYANVQGRFTSVDPLLSSGKPNQPQSWNRYSYVGNYPTVLTDPAGLIWGQLTTGFGTRYYWYKDEEELKAAGATVVTANRVGAFTYETASGHFVRLDLSKNSWDLFETSEQAFYNSHEPNAGGQHYLGGQAQTLELFSLGAGGGSLLKGAGSFSRSLFNYEFTTLGSGIGTTAALRTTYNVSAKRALGYASFEIEGSTGFLVGVNGQSARAGTVEVPSARLFQTMEVGGFTRAFDAEVKILERIGQGISNPQARGAINLFVDRPVCASCGGVINQFRTRFPNVDVTVKVVPYKF